MLLASTFNTDAIFINTSNEGWVALEHQRETVASLFPNWPASHFPFFPCPTNTILADLSFLFPY